MPMRIDDKKIAVKELHEIANKASSAVAADYHGTSVSEITQLRKIARDTKVHLKIIKNTLAKKALSETKFSCLEELLVGPTILAFSLDDPTSAVKLVNNFKKINTSFKVKGLSLGHSLLELTKLTEIANLPSRDQAIGQLARVLIAPLNKLVSLISQVPTKLVLILESIKQQKEEAES